MCGTLLHGDAHLNTSASTNKRFGPPIDRDGAKLEGRDGMPATGAQPPCLFRYSVLGMLAPFCLLTTAKSTDVIKHRFSPSFFAKEAPEIFQHDGDTNRLRLAQGSQRPWIRHACAGGSADTWLFCVGGLLASWQVSWCYASLLFTHRSGGLPRLFVARCMGRLEYGAPVPVA